MDPRLAVNNEETAEETECVGWERVRETRSVKYNTGDEQRSTDVTL